MRAPASSVLPRKRSPFRHGVEETLTKLAAEGVYFTLDEFKGKADVVRGSTAFRVSLS